MTEGSGSNVWHGVRNAIGILRVAVELGCPKIITSCVEYLEAVPWEETEEEEILKIIPSMGSQVEPILARLQPVNATAIMKIFQSAIRFATSSLPLSMNDLKTSAQEQLEYMLTEDDDAPLLPADDVIKLEVVQCVKRMLTRFTSLVDSLVSECQASVSEAEKIQLFQTYLTDLSWACQILTRLESMQDFVYSWMEISESVVKVIDPVPKVEILEIMSKVLEVTSKVLESVGYGSVILPTAKRLHMVKVWLPFVRLVKPVMDTANADDEQDAKLRIDSEFWQSLESTFVSLILTLPSGDQADILTEWLADKNVRYPDLTEAFEVWCYRSKVAKRRLANLGGRNGTSNGI